MRRLDRAELPGEIESADESRGLRSHVERAHGRSAERSLQVAGCTREGDVRSRRREDDQPDIRDRHAGGGQCSVGGTSRQFRGAVAVRRAVADRDPAPRQDVARVESEDFRKGLVGDLLLGQAEAQPEDPGFRRHSQGSPSAARPTA